MPWRSAQPDKRDETNSELLGHSMITLTLDTYSHVIPAMHGDAAAAMDAVFTA
jgi:integrase